RVHRGLAATAIVTTTTPADGAPAVAPANGATTLAPRGRVAAGPRPARRGGAHPLESTAEAAQAWPERQRRHRRRFLLGVAVILVLALAACVGGWWLGDGRFTTVPKLTDLTTSEALAAARHGDLKLTVASTRTHSETVPAGYVARTDPRPGERAHRGATVTAVVSAGPERYRLPAGLVGDRAAAVRVALGGYPLRVEVATTYDEHVARGVVTASTRGAAPWCGAARSSSCT
ncbi:MAG: PASTA domain-containing protein, partial [Mycobacteriales bacterium]